MTESAIESYPRAAWDVIEEICAARFTGQLTLNTATGSTKIYMTRGLIYFAELSTDAPLGHRLASSGAIPAEVMQGRGSARGALDNLDALFSDQPLEVRDNVEAVIQDETEQTLIDIADEEVLSYDSMMYRHHPSGIDRWFSSQHARSATDHQTCTTDIVVVPGEHIEPSPAPVLIPELQPEEVSHDVADAVQRTLSAIESAKKSIGTAPRGFVRAPRDRQPQ